MATELEWLDFNLKSLKLFVESVGHDQKLDRHINALADRNFDGATEFQSRMQTIHRNNAEAYKFRVDTIRKRIKAEEEKIARRGIDIDPQYKRNWEQKVAEVEDYLRAIRISTDDSKPAVPTAKPTSARTKKTDESDKPFPYVAVIAGWTCFIGGWLGILLCILSQNIEGLVVSGVVALLGLGIAAIIGKRMFGTSEHAETAWTIFCALGYVLAFVIILAQAAANNDGKKRK